LKEAVFYQIYPRSFNKDLAGIIEKLDYLKDLGINAIWLSPIYDSPNDDNGYDIRDYEKIGAEFGTMEDFNALLAGVHLRGMKLIMDLVVNHTSDEHEWFRQALRGQNSDYYFFRETPNNWTSFFSGSAWNYYPEAQKYALHLFSKKQMDLNWENGRLREEIYAMIRRWLQKGVDGFRLDVINYISKFPGLPDGDETIGQMMGYVGIERYFFGPRLYEFLSEMRARAFEPFGAFTVGETPGVGFNMARILTDGALDMVFSFDHLENPGKTRFDDYIYDLNYLKKFLIAQAENSSFPSVFFENHYNPRMTSKIDPSGKNAKKVAKLLAAILLTVRGTPFIYQGQEFGATNADFKDISELKDVESINLYNELISKENLKENLKEEAFKKVLAGSRDHSRVPIDWTAESGQLSDEDSVYWRYKKLIKFRAENLLYGNIKFYKPRKKNYFAYDRGNIFIEHNLSDKNIRGRYGILAPYESRFYRDGVLV
jgi:oligo-1,6-glucosidase